MTWQPLQLRGLSFLSPFKDPAVLGFESGLNVICGASDTGKSFVIDAIDFMLGAGSLRDIPERVGYDRARLVMHPADKGEFTLERSTSGGNFSLYEDGILTGKPKEIAKPLRPAPTSGTSESLSTLLLSLIGLADKYLQKNQQGDTKRLGFRDLLKLILIREEAIIKRTSPILTGQLIFQTTEYSLFKLLLTGVDDSGLKTEATQPPNEDDIDQNNTAKVALIDELIEELRSELDALGITRNEAEARLAGLEAEYREQQEALTRTQRNLDERIESRRNLLSQKNRLTGRIDEIAGLLARFELLKEHYQVDLERLAAIEESGSLFVHIDLKPCPLCGAPTENQKHGEGCDGDVASVVRAAAAEIAKVRKLASELDQTISDLRTESEGLATERESLLPELQLINQEINDIVTPFKNAQNSFSDLVRKTSEIHRVIERFDRINALEQRKAALLEAEENASNPSEDTPVLNRPQVDLSASVLDAYAQKVQQLLRTWNFPGSDRVHFDESAKDIVIAGQPRTSRGKGYRAITHAAMTIGLLEFCRDRNLSHPGFVVLDSPLLAYYEPEGEEDSLVGTDLKVRFYQYLAESHADSQVIIIENEHPPAEVTGQLTITDFTKNPNEGRYGLFPLSG